MAGISRLAISRLALLAFTLPWTAAVLAQQGMSPKETTHDTKTVAVLAAGSLREAFDALGKAYQNQSGVKLAAAYGPSGKLRDEIEQGRAADVFASAAPEHTQALAAHGLLARSTVFAYNDLCVVARPALGLNADNLLEVLARPGVRLASSTPKLDPMGDYTWQFFHKADGVRPGLFATFDAKAMKLSGASAPLPGQKPPYVSAFEDGKADAYVMYCTNAASTRRALPELAVVRIPDALNVRSSYGIGARPGSNEGARFVDFVLGPEGKRILAEYGFD